MTATSYTSLFLLDVLMMLPDADEISICASTTPVDTSILCFYAIAQSLRPCYTSHMDILCERFREKMDDKDAHCMAPEEFCKYRDTCMVFLIEEQRKKEKRAGN